MWKSYPPELWRSGRLEGSYVDNVEKLSTGIVEKALCCSLCGKCGKVIHRNCEKKAIMEMTCG